MWKNKTLRLILGILFNLFWAFSMLIVLVESVTYRGAFMKHFRINPMAVLLGLFLFGFSLLVLKIKRKEKVRESVFLVEAFLFASVTFVYVLFKVLNTLLNANFVFSKIHVQPDNLLWVVMIAFVPLLVNIIQGVYSGKAPKLPIFIFWACILLIVSNIFNTYKGEEWAFRFIVAHPRASYGEKMSRAVGTFFYNYTQFINANTPKDAALLMPPQAFPWPQSGNGAFLRYFVYPRVLGNGGEYLPGPKVEWKNFDYVLLDWGETDSVDKPYTHGWPKFDVPAEKIIFMNKDGSYGGEKIGDYHYKDYLNREVWGLIKVKH
jgi:hypothetical protein